MKGYKAFESDLSCRGFQYEIGKEYSIEGDPVMCETGFHFCSTIIDCYWFYPATKSTRICEIEATGDIIFDEDGKYCTNKIKIINEVKEPWVYTNTNKGNTGCYNTGVYNSGSWNTGNGNKGARNTGRFNEGSNNTGSFNEGSDNTGSFNSGNWNTGSFNRGDYNTGRFNEGSHNSGDFNTGNFNSGIFNTNLKPTIKMFDKDSTWTWDKWKKSIQYEIMITYPDKPEDRQSWWDGLTELERKHVYDLPNFDLLKFERCTGVKVKDYERR